MSFPDAFYRYLREHTLVEIRVGSSRERFTELWMVDVDGRVFARSWNRSAGGWFGALVDGEPGEVRYGDATLAVRGVRPAPEAGLMARIDRAYRDRYTQPHNLGYADAISRPAYHPYTVEIRPATPDANPGDEGGRAGG